MSKKLSASLLTALCLALAACGGEDEPDTSGATGDAPANVQQAVEACKQSVASAPNLSDDVKNELTETCDKASSGDEQDIKDATRQVCTRIIEESVPAGPARDQAIETCRTATE